MGKRCVHVFGLITLLCVQICSISISSIPEVTQENFQQTLKEKKCMFLYGSNENCKKCDLLYNKFVTVSQIFSDEADIFFGHFSDKALVEAFNVDSFPAIVFYEFGSAVPKSYLGDVTTAALTKVVEQAMKVDSNQDERFAVRLTKENFDDIIGNEHLYRLVMLHEDDDEDDVATFDDLAQIYDNDIELVFARINVDKQRNLDYKYIADIYPSFYWYPKGTTDKKKRYGGELKIQQMVTFINQQTGLLRTKDGRLSPFAGLIKPLNDVLDTHGTHLYNVINIDEIRTDVKAAIKKLPEDSDKELVDYYLHLLDELEEDGTIETLGESRNRLYREIESSGPLKRDQLARKRNIVQKFIDIIGKHMLADLSEGNVDFSESFENFLDDPNHGMEFHDEF